MMLILGAFGGKPVFLKPADSAWFSYIEGAARGEESSLAALYDASSRLIYGVVMKILGNPADAEEVTLDVYSQVWRSAADYSPERGSPSTWLILLARSRALDRLRSRQGRHKHEAAIEDAAGARSAEPPPEAAALFSEQRKLVRSALTSLAPEQREAIELSFFGGLTHTELAERLGQPLGTVKTRIRLGMMKLRQSLSSSGMGGRKEEVQ